MRSQGHQTAQERVCTACARSALRGHSSDVTYRPTACLGTAASWRQAKIVMAPGAAQGSPCSAQQALVFWMEGLSWRKHTHFQRGGQPLACFALHIKVLLSVLCKVTFHHS